MSSSAANETPPAHPLVGAVLRGTYRVADILDQGGMGTVFAAEHLRLRRQLVVKVLARHLLQDPQALARFQREAEIVSQIAHPHVVQIVDFDTTPDGEPYIVMERLEGETLASRLERERRLDAAEVALLTHQVASGLSAAHRVDVVHRDLKPANIFLVSLPGERWLAKLLDFGISRRAGVGRRLTGEHEVLGTPEYMSPEQALGQTAHVDHRADQYSLAVIAYEALAGDTPFPGNTVLEVLRQVIANDPMPIERLVPNLPAGVWPVLRRALSKEPAARYPGVIEFAAALLSATGRSAPPPGAFTGASSRPPPMSGTKNRAEGRYRVSTPARDNGRVSHSATPGTAELCDQLSAARIALGSGNRELASRHADGAFELANTLGDTAKAELNKEASLLDAIWASFLPPHSLVQLRKSPPENVQVVPEQAFLLSRLEGSASVEELVDLSPLSRHETLRHLVQLVRQGMLEVNTQ